MMSLDKFVETEQAKPWKPRRKKEQTQTKEKQEPKKRVQEKLEPDLRSILETIILDLGKSLQTNPKLPDKQIESKLEKRMRFLEQAFQELQHENLNQQKELIRLKQVIQQQHEQITILRTLLMNIEKEMESMHKEVDEKIIQTVRIISSSLKKMIFLNKDNHS